MKSREDTIELGLRQFGRANNFNVVTVQVKDFQNNARRFSRVTDLKSALAGQLKREYACFGTPRNGDSLDHQQRHATRRLRARSERSNSGRRGIQQCSVLIVS